MELGSKSPQKELLRCLFCSGFYEDPKTLPCLHTFCKKCLLKNIQNKITDISKKCPVCQETFDGDPEDIDNNVFLQNWVKFYKARAKDLVNPICVVCKLRLQKNIAAAAQCISCLDFLCEACSNIHTYTTSTINHQVLSLTEIKTGKYDYALFMVKFKRAFCPIHPAQELSFYCRPCHTLTCNLCTVLGHKRHDVKSLNGFKEEKFNATKKICEKLKEKLNKLNQSKHSMESKQDQLKTQRTTLEKEITKMCSEAVSRIHKRGNKVKKDLDNFYLPKLTDLETVVNKMNVQCNIIKQALQYAEFVFNGATDEIILSLDKLKERLENLAKGDDDKGNEVLFSYSTTETSNLTLKIHVTEPNFTLLLENDQPFSKENEQKSGNTYSKDDYSSDFIRLSDKATQTLEEDFGKSNGIKDTEKKKYKISLMKSVDLTADDDKHKPYFTGVAWIDENEFVAVDAGNGKLKIYSLLSGKILKKVKIAEPLAVSVWGGGIACLSKDNKLTRLTPDLCPQQTLPNVSSLFSSLPSLNQLTWIENITIFIRKKDTFTKIPLDLKSTRPIFIRYACCLPNGSFVISDKTNTCVHLVDTHGKIFRTVCCNPGSITFEKYYNIFVTFFDTASIWVYNIDGTYITSLHLDERPRSISILHDKLLVAVEHGCKVFVYDITYK